MKENDSLSDAIKILSIEAVQKANSGHPGMPMGMSDIAAVLWDNFLMHSPANPKWINRDRFVVSNGHGSMLLYSLLHLTGYDLSIDDIKNFRQLNSKTPGHPEYDIELGIETTTGPLGQGLANAVGMAIASKVLGNTFNEEDIELINNTVYCFVGDGCLMEGISHEVSSLAGTLSLDNLIVFWDNNGISIDGKVENWCQDNTLLRFESYNWDVIEIDGHNQQEIYKAIEKAKSNKKPTLISCKTTIAKDSPNFKGTAKSHGAPLGQEEIDLIKKEINWNYKEFTIPNMIYEKYNAKEKGKKIEDAWNEKLKAYSEKYPEKTKEFDRRIKGKLPSIDFSSYVNNIKSEHNSIATRKATEILLKDLLNMPELLGGSADLSGSNLTITSESKVIKKDSLKGNYLYYGVREFGMFAIMNGISLFGGVIPFGGTFLVFSDYARNAMRLSAMMKQKVIYILTHDSIGLGEDGPTHQPIEHISSLRMIPNLNNWRPCDIEECVFAWESALNYEGPTSFILSRQKLSKIEKTSEQVENIKKGGYILYENKKAVCTLIATGSEVEIAIDVAKELGNVRVVSMPCTEVFFKQSQEYKDNVLGKNKKIVIETASPYFWYKIADFVIGIDEFGASGKAKDLFEHYGFSKNKIIEKIKGFLN